MTCPMPVCDELLIETIPVDVEDDSKGVIALFIINRPTKLNALGKVVRDAIFDAVQWAECDESVKTVILAAAPPPPAPEGKRPLPAAFAAGFDITEFVGPSPEEIREYMKTKSVFEGIWNCRLPTIAMIDGLALGGGCEIAMGCDIRLASQRSIFGQPEIKLGLIPGGGGTQRLTKLVGYGKAMEMILSGNNIGAEEALRIGLIDYIHTQEELREKTLELARSIAQWSSLTLDFAKRAVRASLEEGMSPGIETEADLFAGTFATKDKELGVQAFLETKGKVPPKWTGK